MLDIDWRFSTTEILSIQLGLFNRSTKKNKRQNGHGHGHGQKKRK